jgi:aspartyl-tRNA(Asn)/glutamyl-tRNA(Gln) amidotransferase subunit A
MIDEQLTELIDDPTKRAAIPAIELAQAFLDRIAKALPAINAFITVMAEQALSDARRIDAGRAKGVRLPLDGMPIAVKDNLDTAGVRTTVGSKVFERNVPTRDAEVVRRLREAGAVFLGKANMHELAYGTTSKNLTYGTVHNPWDLTRVPGGSSGGSGAALAADLCVGAIGSDTGGSIRVPAAVNGVSGLRPSYGSVSNRGSYPVSWSFDTIGPLARSVEDVFRIQDAIAGFDPDDPRSVEPHEPPRVALPSGRLDGLRVGLPRAFFFDELEPDVAASVEAAARTLESLGAKLADVTLAGAAESMRVCNLIIRAEALAFYAEHLDATPELIAEDIAARLRLGEAIGGVELAGLYQHMHEWRRAVRALFAGVDLILTPATDSVAPPIEGSTTLTTTATMTRFTYPWSLAQLPGLVVPCAPSAASLPIGIQFVARPWAEPLLRHAGNAFQRATGWHRLRPPAPWRTNKASRAIPKRKGRSA